MKVSAYSGARIRQTDVPLLLLITIITFSASPAASLQCIGEDGTAVDWWLALKAPGTDRSGNTKYGYVDNNSALCGPARKIMTPATTNCSDVEDGAYVWREGTQISGTSSNPPADTLAPLYGGTTDIGYVVWNDEPGASHCKSCTSFVLGHSKGVLGFDEDGGFWLSHSVPKYPDSPYDSSFTGIQVGQTLNGQDFACISLDASAVNKVAKAITVADVYIYSPHSISKGLKAKYPDVSKLATTALGRDGPVEPQIAVSDSVVSTLGGQELRIFAKSSTGSDGDNVRMWEDVVEQGLKEPMLVQSWPESKDLPSYCGPPDSKYESLTITSLAIPGTSLAWTTRTAGTYKDHSKWGIANPDGQNQEKTFCAGDNNRAVTQDFRGGTAICFLNNDALFYAVNSTITSVQPCQESRGVQ